MEINQSRGTIQSETISTIIITTLWLVAYKLPNYAIISFLPLCLSATAHKLWPTFNASLPVLTQLFFNSRHGRDKATEASERLSFKCSDSWKARPKMSWDQDRHREDDLIMQLLQLVIPFVNHFPIVRWVISVSHLQPQIICSLLFVFPFDWCSYTFLRQKATQKQFIWIIVAISGYHSIYPQWPPILLLFPVALSHIHQ